MRRWSDLPLSEYRVASSGRYVEAAKLFVGRTPAWNLFWATAVRLELGAQGSFVYLARFDPETERRLFRAPSQRVELHPKGLNKWTLAAAMCRYSPAEFMHHYWPQIVKMLKLPNDQGHVYLG